MSGLFGSIRFVFLSKLTLSTSLNYNLIDGKQYHPF